MNDALKMQISAFVDGELPENEAELLMRRLNQDLAMRQQVARYLAIGRHIRRDVEPPGMHELRGRIAVALGEESMPSQLSQSPEGSRYLKPALGFAVAASVAVLAVVGLRQSILPVVDTVVPAPSIAASGQAPSITQAPASSADADVVSEELRQMYRRHSASSADFGANGIITRLVTLELQGGELVEINPEYRSGNPSVSDETQTSDDESDDESDEEPNQEPDGASVVGEP